MKSLAFLRHHYIIFLLASLLLGVSLLLAPQGELRLFRVVRALVSFSFLALVHYNDVSKNGWLKLHMLFYGLSSLCTIWFEIEWMSVLSMVLNAFSLLFLIKLLLSKLEFKKLGGVMISAFMIVSVVNIWLLYEFIAMLFHEIQSVALITSISITTIVFFVVTVLAFVYLNESNSGPSVTLIFALLFIIFAEVLRGAGYYAVIDEVSGQYFARFLLIIGISLMYHFSYLEVKGSKLF